MAGLRVEQFVVGPVMTNCYFAVQTDTAEALVVDPGDEAERLIGKLKERGFSVAAVLLTHGHFDHASAARQVADAFGAPIYAHELEKETLEEPQINLSIMNGAREAYGADRYVGGRRRAGIGGLFRSGDCDAGAYEGRLLLLYRKGTRHLCGGHAVLRLCREDGLSGREREGASYFHQREASYAAWGDGRVPGPQ